MQSENVPMLQRRLGLALLVLYGTGITVGAGIYVLIGAVAGHAGHFAPWSFVIAAVAMGFTVASYAELAARFPVSAGEAAYARAAFDRVWISRAIGLLTVAIGIVSSAAVAIGSAGYIRQFVAAPEALVILILLVVIGAVASYGILESVVAASVLTLIEVGGLLVIIGSALISGLQLAAPVVPPLQTVVLSGIGFASLLAFFAFIGFEDLANIANVEHFIPRDWISEDGMMPNEKFVEYASPLVQGEMKPPMVNGLPQYVVLGRSLVEKKLPARA